MKGKKTIVGRPYREDTLQFDLKSFCENCREAEPKKIDVVQTMDRQEHEEFLDEYYPREEAKPT
jgi:hypothetical protein